MKKEEKPKRIIPFGSRTHAGNTSEIICVVFPRSSGKYYAVKKAQLCKRIENGNTELKCAVNQNFFYRYLALSFLLKLSKSFHFVITN